MDANALINVDEIDHRLDNVIRICAFAHLHNGHSVVKAASDLIVENFSRIIEQKDWISFVQQHPHLLIDIHKKLAEKN